LHFRKLISVIKVVLLVCIELSVCGQPIHSEKATHHPVVGKNGMVATQHHLATEVGLDILKQGGNAIDAAVAVGFALAVVLPRAGNLGGGGFMLVHLHGDSISRAINYREKAPKAAYKDMYLNQEGVVDNNLFNLSYSSVGIPGTVAGLVYALEKYGTMPLKKVIKPAIKLAAKGFPISDDLSRILIKYEDRLKAHASSKAIFYKKQGYYQPGEILKQKELAWSLKQIKKKGRSAFYHGKIATKLVHDIQANGGIITLEDLSDYTVEETPAVSGTYKGYQILSMPPPSSGGVHIIQILNILEQLEIEKHPYGSADYLHLLAESMRLAYADRSHHLGDPNFWKVPVEGLLSKEYASELAKKINIDAVNASYDISPGSPQDFESKETTHYSIVDKFGNAVSNTYTLNFSFGTGIVAEGTGILLNNEMGDFSAKPGSPNAYGLIGGEANAVEAGKRPLSSMSPTIVLHNNAPYLITGSPGGSRIITSVIQILLNVLEHDMNVAQASHAPRIHHQWYPDILFHEVYFNPDTKDLLRKKGHQLQQRDAMGSTQSIRIRDGWIYGASDPRRPDASTKGY
jgi:gamma-glutamyltranspeptidase/glutathione hydrolase